LSRMPPKKIIYPIFLPHAGCPFQCVYCNQNAVTSNCTPENDPLAIAGSCLGKFAEDISNSGAVGEIAFYGGTFTALPTNVLQSILRMTSQFVRNGIFTGIRFSTRPDCLGTRVCEVLSAYPVKTVELGVQSMSDRVLSAGRRGYDRQTVLEAAEQIKNHGWALGIQLMAGLPEDTLEIFLDSVRATISICPDFVRIYPTLVLNGTLLADWFASGSYRPLSLDDAVKWVADAYDMFISAGIPVIRMGLHSDPALEKPGVIAGGPHHPAFGQLVRCRRWRDRVDGEFAGMTGLTGCNVSLYVPSNLVSDVIGPGRSNIRHWKSVWKLRNLKVIGRQRDGSKELEMSFTGTEDGGVSNDNRENEPKTI
jgi:histone acetyltransferase (RNA polymerase elongator complex component)